MPRKEGGISIHRPCILGSYDQPWRRSYVLAPRGVERKRGNSVARRISSRSYRQVYCISCLRFPLRTLIFLQRIFGNEEHISEGEGSFQLLFRSIAYPLRYIIHERRSSSIVASWHPDASHEALSSMIVREMIFIWRERHRRPDDFNRRLSSTVSSYFQSRYS